MESVLSEGVRPPIDPAANDLRLIGSLAVLVHELQRLLLRQERRTGKKIKKVALAKALGISVSSLYGYLNGTTLPPSDKFDDLLRQLDVPASEWHRLTTARDELEILRRGPTLSSRIPHDLPHDVVGFTGRTKQLAELDDLLKESQQTPAIVISAVSGAGGVGKTALAIHWGHRAAERFPDGQLYIDLRGYGPGPTLSSSEALEKLLRAIGVVPTEIPLGEDERAALFRSILSSKRMIILLDNAATSNQVRPLLPGSPTCLVLVTSRSSLHGLAIRDGAKRLSLGNLSREESTALLQNVVGGLTSLAKIDYGTLDILARLCAGLPLALRIAGERVSRMDVPLPDLIEELTDERHRLDVLSVSDEEDVSIRAVFSWSYQSLQDPEARIFRLLGIHSGAEFGVPVVAALAETTNSSARQLLEALVSAHMLERGRLHRYRFHDLVRCYAAECAATEPFDHQRLASRRIVLWYLHSAAEADRVFAPDRLGVPMLKREPGLEPQTFDGHAAATDWCELERANLVAAVRQAAANGDDDLAWQLPAILGEFFYLCRYMDDWLATHEIGLASARRLGNRTAQGWILTNLGIAYVELGWFPEAVKVLEEAVALLRDLLGEATEDAVAAHVLGVSLTFLGSAWEHLESINKALDYQQQALVVGQAAENKWGVAWVLTYLGQTNARAERPAEAIVYLQQAIKAQRAIKNTWREGVTLSILARVLADDGQYAEAIATYHMALDIHRTMGNRWQEGTTQLSFSDLLQALGRDDEARQQRAKATRS